MQKNDENILQRDVLPENFNSLEEFWNFWDTHSSADYEDFMEPVDADITLSSRKLYCAIAKDLLDQVRIYAGEQGVSAETLINLWIKEKLLSKSG